MSRVSRIAEGSEPCSPLRNKDFYRSNESAESDRSFGWGEWHARRVHFNLPCVGIGLAKGIEDETGKRMILGWVFRVIEDRHLRAFLESGCTPSGFSLIGLLIEGDELVFDDWHALP